MNNSPEYSAAQKTIESFSVKVLKRAVLFLDKNKKPFAGVNKAGVWMSVSKVQGGKHAGKNYYSYISSIEEKNLGIDKLKYGENCDLAKEIVRKYLTLGD